MTSIPRFQDFLVLHKQFANGFVGGFSMPLSYSMAQAGPGRRIPGDLQYDAEPGRRRTTRRRASAPVSAWLQHAIDSSNDGDELLHALQERPRRRWVSSEIECMFRHLATSRRSPTQLETTMHSLALQSSSSLTVSTATIVLTTATGLGWESNTALERALHQRILLQARRCAPDELVGAFEALQRRFEVLDVDVVRHWQRRLRSTLDDDLQRRIEGVLLRAERIRAWQQCRLAVDARDRLIERRLRDDDVDDDELCAMAWSWSKTRSSSTKHALVGNLIAERSVANPGRMKSNAAIASVCHALQEGGLDHDDLFNRVSIWLQRALPTMLSGAAFRLFYSLAMTGHTTDALQKTLVARFRSETLSVGGIDYLAAGLARSTNVVDDTANDVIDAAERRLRVAFESTEIARLLDALALARMDVDDATVVDAAFGRLDPQALSLPTLIVTCWSTSLLSSSTTPARVCLSALRALEASTLVDIAPELLRHIHDLRLQVTTTTTLALPPDVSERVDDVVESGERALQRCWALQRNQVRELATSLDDGADVLTSYRCASTGFILDAFWPRKQVAFCVEDAEASSSRALVASFVMRRRMLRRHGIKVCVASAERISELMRHDNDLWLSDVVEKAAADASGDCVFA